MTNGSHLSPFERIEEFHDRARRDFEEMQVEYPFSRLSFPLSSIPYAKIEVVAANVFLIEKLRGVREDFLGDYSKELVLKAPIGYRAIGCEVYGASWIQLSKLRREDRHFHNACRLTKYGYRLCVGVPESFFLMDNVFLECVKTAENMLIAYERVMRGETDRLELAAYSHGLEGLREFQRDRNRHLVGKGE